MPQQIVSKNEHSNLIIQFDEDGFKGKIESVIFVSDNIEKALETFNRLVLKGEPLHPDSPNPEKYNKASLSLLVSVVKRTDIVRNDYIRKIECNTNIIGNLKNFILFDIEDARAVFDKTNYTINPNRSVVTLRSSQENLSDEQLNNMLLSSYKDIKILTTVEFSPTNGEYMKGK